MVAHAIAIADTFAKALSHQIATPDARHAPFVQLYGPWHFDCWDIFHSNEALAGLRPALRPLAGLGERGKGPA